MAGIPTALQNRVELYINGQRVVEATDVSISAPLPTGGRFGAAGLIGIFHGQALCKIDITFAQPYDKAQFEAFALTAQGIEDALTGFAFVFTKGLSRFLVQPCVSGDAGMRNNYEAGTNDVTLSLIGARPKQIA